MMKILVVENPEFMSKILKCQLEPQEFMIAEAGSLQAAAQKMNRESFNVILLDLLLPDGNGLRLFDDFAAYFNVSDFV